MAYHKISYSRPYNIIFTLLNQVYFGVMERAVVYYSLFVDAMPECSLLYIK